MGISVGVWEGVGSLVGGIGDGEGVSVWVKRIVVGEDVSVGKAVGIAVVTDTTCSGVEIAGLQADTRNVKHKNNAR